MPEYRYTGSSTRVFHGLQVGRNAWPARPAPDLSTLVLRPGDTVRTRGPVSHTLLTETPKPSKPAKTRKPKPQIVIAADGDQNPKEITE